MDAHRLNELRDMIDNAYCFITTMNAKLDTLWNMVEGAAGEVEFNCRGFKLGTISVPSSGHFDRGIVQMLCMGKEIEIEINDALKDLKVFIHQHKRVPRGSEAFKFKSQVVCTIDRWRGLKCKVVEMRRYLHILEQSTPHLQTLSKLRTSTLCTRIVGM